MAKVGDKVCIKIEPPVNSANIEITRNFEIKDQLISRITRKSIDAVKEYFKEELSTDDWKLMVALKKELGIP